MIIGILQNTPLWVWAVLLGLVVLGLLQARTRRVNRLLVFLLPAIMVPLSLYAVIASFGVSTAGLSAWIAGVAAAVAVNGLVFLSPKGVHYSVEDQAFELPGSWVPLTLMLTIFCARFAVGVSTALSASIVGTVGFVGGVSVILGACSGLFLSRAMRILSVQRRAAARSDRQASGVLRPHIPVLGLPWPWKWHGWTRATEQVTRAWLPDTSSTFSTRAEVEVGPLSSTTHGSARGKICTQ